MTITAQEMLLIEWIIDPSTVRSSSLSQPVNLNAIKDF